MTAKKRKDISQEVGKLEDEGQDASQKALDLAKFAEATKSTFESLSPDFTEETSQAIGQASHELQGSIDRNHGEVLQESEDVLDELEQKQKGFEGAIIADKSDISKLNALQAEGDVVGDSKIVQVQESKQEEIDFLSDLTKDIEAAQDDINQKLDESRQRRQAARLKYKSKSIDNNQAGSSESEGNSHTEFETSLDSQVENDRTTSEKIAKDKAAFGNATTNNYKNTFFDAFPELKGQVVVHHAVEQQVLKRYLNLISEAEMHSLENLRGIPNQINEDVHLSQIRKIWNKFYKTNPKPTKEQLLEQATQIDNQFGKLFKPPI